MLDGFGNDDFVVFVIVAFILEDVCECLDVEEELSFMCEVCESVMERGIKEEESLEEGKTDALGSVGDGKCEPLTCNWTFCAMA